MVGITLQFLCFLFILGSCQISQTNKDTNIRNNLSSDNGQLDLSRTTLEQQNIEKAQAKESLLEARKKRVVILSNPEEPLAHNLTINIAVYARLTTNSIGERIYNRAKVKKKKLDSCLRFASDDDAQRFFLLKNGPGMDFWNLDQDGDGFACSWDPDRYRQIVVQ